METGRVFLVCFVMFAFALPSASAQGVLPSMCDGWVGGCLDAVAPRATPSRLLPLALHPDPAAEAAAPEPSARVAASSADPAPEPAGGDPVAPGPEAAAEREFASADALGILIVALTLLALLAGVVVASAVPRRRVRAHRTSLAAAARASAMQRDIDEAWREARRASSGSQPM